MLLRDTHLLGIVSLSLAALVAITRPGRAWRGGAAALAIMAAAIATDATGQLHDMVENALKADGLYREHGRLQWAITLGLAIPFATACAFVAWRIRGAALALSAAVLALAALFVAQAISLHAVDAVLGRAAGPVMVVAWGWLAGALAVMAAALVDERRRRRRRRR